MESSIDSWAEYSAQYTLGEGMKSLGKEYGLLGRIKDVWIDKDRKAGVYKLATVQNKVVERGQVL